MSEAFQSQFSQVTLGERGLMHEYHSIVLALQQCLPKKRRVSLPEKERVVEMFLTGAATAAIKNTVNEVRKATGQEGMLITKDIHDLIHYQTRTGQTKRVLRS